LLLNLLKIFKISEVAIGRLSIVLGPMQPAFQKKIVHRQPICQVLKTGEIAPCRLSKALRETPRNLSSNRSKKDFNSPVLNSFQKIQKLLHLAANNLLIPCKIKGKVYKIMNICRGLSPNQDLSNHPTKTEF
jgi:hypothetical protein